MLELGKEGRRRKAQYCHAPCTVHRLQHCAPATTTRPRTSRRTPTGLLHQIAVVGTESSDTGQCRRACGGTAGLRPSLPKPSERAGAGREDSARDASRLAHLTNCCQEGVLTPQENVIV
ncbi:hypothetical protein E2C01_081999 [Portunus trituberculatus]|uniref:Uncharacterized protein n=1 Tax=Portunus trituberculatus TaxID=210409 RepID=A0A5B7J0E4_PORTR|nr:hypothetical protein [Portunus trituberculatus]